MPIIIHVCHLPLMIIFGIYDFANVLHYFDVCFKCLLHHVYVLFAVMIVHRSGINLG